MMQLMQQMDSNFTSDGLILRFSVKPQLKLASYIIKISWEFERGVHANPSNPLWLRLCSGMINQE